MLRNFGFVFIVFMIAACAEQKPDTTISKKEFEEIYTQAVLINLSADSTRKTEMIDSLLKAHNTTLDQLAAKAKELNENPTEWITFFDEVTKELQKIEDENIKAAKSEGK